MAGMNKKEASDKVGQACAIIEDVMEGLYGTDYPAPNEDAFADDLSETRDKLDELQDKLQASGKAFKAGK